MKGVCRFGQNDACVRESADRARAEAEFVTDARMTRAHAPKLYTYAHSLSAQSYDPFLTPPATDNVLHVALFSSFCLLLR